jgi:hypothetical protein
MSTASTWNECGPPYELVTEFPDAQLLVEKPALSMLQRNVASVAGSVQLKVALDEKLVGLPGWAVSVGVGGGVGTQGPLAGQVMVRLGMLPAVYPSLVLVQLTVVV